MSVTPSQFGLIRKSLDVANIRHGVISNNLANANTPGFQASHVEFQQELLKEMDGKRPDPGTVNAEVVKTSGLRERFDGNNVDMDQQISEMDKNALLFQSLTQVMATKISMMRTAITGR